MTIELQTFFSTPLLLGVGTGIALGPLLLLTCRVLRKGEEAEHKRAIAARCDLPPGEEKLAKLLLQGNLARRGSPADRLFVYLLVAATMAAMLYVIAWSSGLTPAGAREREIISLLKSSDYANNAALAGALRSIDESLYISRSDYLLLSSAFNRVAISDYLLLNRAFNRVAISDYLLLNRAFNRVAIEPMD